MSNILKHSFFVFIIAVLITVAVGLVIKWPLKNTGQLSVAEDKNTNKITSAEVTKHNAKSNCWIIVDKKVYNVTSLLGKNPGNAAQITAACGKDGAFAFNAATKSILDKYYVADLKQ